MDNYTTSDLMENKAQENGASGSAQEIKIQTVDNMLKDQSAAFLTEQTTLICDSGHEYIVSTERIGEGGASQVYAAYAGDGESKKYAAKLTEAFTDIVGEAEIRSILKKSDAEENGLMPILDSGELSGAGDVRYRVDIMPYYEEGTVDGKFSYKKLVGLISSINETINYLHSNGIVHRDIKPENIYCHNGKYILGDFGSATKINVSNPVGSGTPGYCLAEGSRGGLIYRGDLDFFSFGCTIATLYNGRHVYERFIGRDDGDAFFNDKIKYEGLPLKCPDSEKDIQTLVDALTKFNPADRAGYKDVRCWLNNRDEFVGKWKHEGGKTPDFFIRFGGKPYYSEIELTEAVIKNWEYAKRNFFQDRVTDDDTKFVHLFKSYPNHVGADMHKNASDTGEDLDLYFAKFLVLFNCVGDINAPPLFWKNVRYSRLSEIAKDIRESKNLDEIKRIIGSGFLTWYLEKLQNNGAENVTPDMIKTVKLLKTAENKKVFFTLRAFADIFEATANNEKKDVDAAVSSIISWDGNINELCFYYASALKNDEKADSVYETVLRPMVRCGKLEDALHIDRNWEPGLIRGLSGSAETVAHKYAIYKVLENVSTNKSPVRKAFLENGPYSCIYWIYTHLDMYIATGDDAKAIISDIKKVNVNSERTIEENLTGLKSLHMYFSNLFKGFNYNILNAATNELKGFQLYSNEYDAYSYSAEDEFFKNNILEKSDFVPIGFTKKLNYYYYASNIEKRVTEFLNTERRFITKRTLTNQYSVFGGGEYTETVYLDKYNVIGSFSALTYLFSMYFSNYFSKQSENKPEDAYAFAVKTVSGAESGSSSLSNYLGRCNAPKLVILRMYEAINKGIAEGTQKSKTQYYAGFKSSIENWNELGLKCRKDADSEYEDNLKGKKLSYEELSAQKPDDYRPVWEILKTTMASKLSYKQEAERIYGNLQKKENDLLSKPKKKVESYDFYCIIKNVEDAENKFEPCKKNMETFIDQTEPRVKSLASRAGSNNTAILEYWEKYKKDTLGSFSVNYTAIKDKWTRELRDFEGLCVYCGGKISRITKKCKKCGKSF